MNSSLSLDSFRPVQPDEAGVLSWVHIGDLHMVRFGEQNHLDLKAIVDEVNAVFAGAVSFVFIPGDIADDGSKDAYAIVRGELDRLRAPWCAIVGDHDVHEKSFKNFRDSMAERTHYAFVVGSVRFVAMNAFDIPDPPSFTVSDDQLTWVKRELQTAADLKQSAVILLHCYPSDLKVNGGPLHEVIHNYRVRLVDMGHTHYNEISNDGKTLYTATRSTGQIEEGPVGFSVTNIDGDAISWRFFELNTLPAVMITSPSDERLITVFPPRSQELTVRTKIWNSQNVRAVTARIATQNVSMDRIGGSQVWQATIDASTMPDGVHPITVTAEDESGGIADDTIRAVLGDAQQDRQRAIADHENALEAWPEHGLLGTRLGPNKNGKKW